MSWSYPPRLVASEGGVDQDINWQDGLSPPRPNPLAPSNDNYFCDMVISGVTFTNECWHGASRSGTLEFPIAELLDTIPDVHDWYSIHVSCSFPVMPAGHAGCVSGVDNSCDGPQLAVDAAIVGGTLVSNSFGTPLDQSDSHGAVSQHIDLPVAPDTNFGLLLNAAPSFPVPDADGNEAGSVLFSRAEAEAIGHDIVLEWGQGGGTLWGYWDVTNVSRSPFIHTTISIFFWRNVVLTGPQPGFITARPPISGVIRRKRRAVS